MRKKTPLTLEQTRALNRFAEAHGRTWKSRLRSMWMNGRDALEPDGAYLRQVRNSQPPSFLDTYRASAAATS